ncbi:hypothetical protein BCA37_17710 [Mycobacterium sp. djl-10]|nr:hypothetical protein BCA37_17710 [Mycobacterium sp. djl-10]
MHRLQSARLQLPAGRFQQRQPRLLERGDALRLQSDEDVGEVDAQRIQLSENMRRGFRSARYRVTANSTVISDRGAVRFGFMGIDIALLSCDVVFGIFQHATVSTGRSGFLVAQACPLAPGLGATLPHIGVELRTGTADVTTVFSIDVRA